MKIVRKVVFFYLNNIIFYIRFLIKILFMKITKYM